MDNTQYQQPVYVDPYDHTSEFSAEDIKNSKVFVLAAYLCGVIGIIVALLAVKESPYAKFHIKQIIRFKLIEIALLIVTLVLVWTIIVPIAAAIFAIFLEVIYIIAIVQTCEGRAVEAVFLRKIEFLK